MARIEFFAVKEDIEDLIRRGYNFKLAYEKLKNEGRITMSFDAFYGHLNPRKKKASSLQQTQPPATNQLPQPLEDGRRSLGVGNSESTIKTQYPAEKVI